VQRLARTETCTSRRSHGANDTQATKALLEADAYPGTSLIIAYSTCIAHGIDMSKSMSHQKDASGRATGRCTVPSLAGRGGQPFQLDCKAPSIPLAEFVATEARYATLPGLTSQAARLAALAQADVTESGVLRAAGFRATHGSRGRVRRESKADARLKTVTTRRSSDGRNRLSGPETTYLGLQLRRDCRSAGPLTRTRGAKALADAGVGAVVLPSLFEEEIIAEEVGLSFALEAGSEHFAEALDYFPTVSNFTSEADRYLELLEEIKKAVRVPVIASLNASSTRLGALCQTARGGRRGRLELNVYRFNQPGADCGAVEEVDLALVKNVCAVCHCRSP